MKWMHITYFYGRYTAIQVDEAFAQAALERGEAAVLVPEAVADAWKAHRNQAAVFDLMWDRLDRETQELAERARPKKKLSKEGKEKFDALVDKYKLKADDKKAQTTLYGMIESGEVPHSTDEEGRIAVSPTDVASAPRRKRGHPFGDPETFRGKLFMALLGYGYTVTRIANRYNISRQAVSKAIALYKERTGTE